MTDEESLLLVLCTCSGFSFSSFFKMLSFVSLLRLFSSFSELGSEEDDDEEDEDDKDEEEEHEKCTVLLCVFSESLLSDRSEVMSVFNRFTPAFFSSSSHFLRLFTACLPFSLESAQ